MSFLLAFIAVLGIWKIQSYYKEKRLAEIYSDVDRIDMGEGSLILVTESEFIYLVTFLGQRKEISKINRSKITGCELGSELHIKDRKSDCSIILSWEQDDESTKELSFDFVGPTAIQNANKFIKLASEFVFCSETKQAPE